MRTNRQHTNPLARRIADAAHNRRCRSVARNAVDGALLVGLVVLAGGCAANHSNATDTSRFDGDPAHTLTIDGAHAFNLATDHALQPNDIIALVGFDQLDDGWFAVIVADQIAIDGEPVSLTDGSDQPAIVLWGLNLDTPSENGEAAPPWAWHYTNSVLWLSDPDAVAKLCNVGFDARLADIVVDTGSDPEAPSLNAVSINADDLRARLAVTGRTAEPNRVAPFERSAVHWSRSYQGQGVAQADYAGQQGSDVAAELFFTVNDAADDAAPTDFGAAFADRAPLLSTTIDRMQLRFESILPAEARKGLAAVELSD